MKPTTKKTKKPVYPEVSPVREDLPVNLGMLHGVRDELMAESRAQEHRIDANFIQVQSNLDSVKAELRSDMHRMEATISRMDATLNRMEASMHRMEVLYEEQNTRNAATFEIVSTYAQTQKRQDERIDFVERSLKTIGSAFKQN
jgi:hypothetical protein